MCDTLSLERNRRGETERERKRDGRLVLELNQTVSWCRIPPEATEGRAGGREGRKGKRGAEQTERELGHGEGKGIMMEEAWRLEG